MGLRPAEGYIYVSSLVNIYSIQSAEANPISLKEKITVFVPHFWSNIEHVSEPKWGTLFVHQKQKCNTLRTGCPKRSERRRERGHRAPHHNLGRRFARYGTSPRREGRRRVEFVHPAAPIKQRKRINTEITNYHNVRHEANMWRHDRNKITLPAIMFAIL